MRFLVLALALLSCGDLDVDEPETSTTTQAATVLNGSFESGDYTGWTLLEEPANGAECGTFGNVGEGQVIDPNGLLFDFFDNLDVSQSSSGLPITFDATEGIRLAVQLQNCGQTHRMFQTVTLDAGCATLLRWDMRYTNHNSGFDDLSQYTAVNVRDPVSDAVLATPFKTTVASAPPLSLAGMTPFEADLSAFDGQTVRIDFEHQVNSFFFDIAWDNIRLACGTPVPQISVAPSPHDFGDQRVGTTSGNQTFTITNIGTADLVVNAISTAAPFQVTPGALPATIAPGNNRTFTGRFSPGALGVANGTISIVSNDAASPTVVAVSGNGTAPAISVSPSPHDFGIQRVGTASAPQTFTITNTGTAPLDVSAITTTGPYATANTSFVIPPSGSQNIGVTFSPGIPGPAPGSLRVTHDAVASPTIVNLNGTGVQPLISLSPSPLAFGEQLVGTTSAGQTMTIDNPGTATLNVSAITTTGPFATANTAFAIPPGGSQNISVTFTPTIAGGASGTVVVAHDAPGGPTSSVVASGTGVQPLIDVDPGSLAFGDQRVGTTSTAKTFDLQNPGSADLTITAIAASLPFATANTFPIVVAAGGSTTISVTFAPQTAGSASDTLSITSDAAAGTSTVSLTGNGVEPVISVSALDVGDVRLGTTGNAALVVSNVGTSNLTITALSTTAPFGTTETFPIVIAPGNNASLNITFTPTAPVTVNDTITIDSDAATSPTTVNVTGRGVEPIATPDTASIDFGLQRVGVTSPPRTVVLTNTGTFPLTVGAITTGSPFAVVTAGGLTLQPNQSFAIDVTFTPTAEGVVTQNLQVTHDAGGTTIALQGTGTVAELDASPETLTFGEIRVGTTSPTQLVTLRNLGLAPLAINSITPSAGFVTSGLTVPRNVLPNASVTFEVAFAPGTAGAADGNVAIATSVGTANVVLTATAVTAALTADRTQLDLGTVLLGEASAAQLVQLTNTTDAPIAIGSSVVSDPQFVLDPAPSTAQIPPGGSIMFGVRFVPGNGGAAAGQVDIVLAGETAIEVSIQTAGQGLIEESGCCSTGGGGSSTSLLLGLAVLGLLRRRR